MAPHSVTDIPKGTFPAFDPAIHTLLFDIMLLYSYVGRPSHMCPDCEAEVLSIAERAVEGRIARKFPASMTDEDFFNPFSNITNVWYNPGNNGIYLTTTFTGLHRSFDFLTAATARQHLEYLEAFPGLVDKFIKYLWAEGAEEWSLDQCKLWFAIVGKYTVRAAAAGRDVAEFAEDHRALMNHLVRAGPGGRCERSCFSLGLAPEAYGYRFCADVEMQSQVVYLRCLEMMDEPVRKIFLEAVEDPEWEAVIPRHVREDKDKLRMLKTVASHPEVQNRLRNLRFIPECVDAAANADKRMESWREMMIRDPTSEEHFGEGLEYLTRENFMRLTRWFPRLMREEWEHERTMREREDVD